MLRSRFRGSANTSATYIGCVLYERQDDAIVLQVFEALDLTGVVDG
jgi:hypothetical protein